MPNKGFIKLQGKILSLHGIQIIANKALCKDNNGQWSCGESAWVALNNKLDSGHLYCTIISELGNIEVKPEQAICLLKKENLSVWLVSQGWALTKKESNELLSSQENIANENHKGIWRDGFLPPDIWRKSFKKDSKNCNVCSIRRQSFKRNTSKQEKN